MSIKFDLCVYHLSSVINRSIFKIDIFGNEAVVKLRNYIGKREGGGKPILKLRNHVFKSHFPLRRHHNIYLFMFDLCS